MVRPIILSLYSLLILTVTNTSQNDHFIKYVLAQHKLDCDEDRLCSFNEANEFNQKCRLCPPCQCDSDCRIFGDCCPDKSPGVIGNPDSVFQESRYACQADAIIQSSANSRNLYFFSITTCSLLNDPYLVNLCQSPGKDLYSSRPATSTRSGEVYRNKFCAECNGDSNYILWNLRVNCRVYVAVPPGITNNQSLNYFIQHPGCSVVYSKPPSTNVRTCYSNSEKLMSTCNMTGLWQTRDDFMERACGAYYNPLSVGGKHYRNIFCFYCNTVPHAPMYRICAFDMPFPFSVLMDPEASEKIITRTTESCMCKKNEVYDRFKKICRRTKCSFGHRQEGEICKSEYTFMTGAPYSFEVALTPTTRVSTGLFKTLWMESLASNITMVFTVMTEEYEIQIHRLGVRCITRVNETRIRTLFFLVKFVLLSQGNLDEFEKLLTGFQNSTWTIPFKETFVNLSSASSLTLTETNDTLYNDIYVGITNNALYSQTYAKIFKHTRRNMVITEPKKYTRITATLLCPLIQLNSNEIQPNSEQQSPVLRVLNKTLTPDEFTTDNGKTFICQNIIAGTQKCLPLSPDLVFSKAYIIVSTTCQSISLVCLFVTFVVFCLCPALRTLPGKTTMGLILTLLITVTLNLFGISRVEHSTVCRVIGLLIHFFLLSSFTWMGICSLHMYMVFKDVLASRTSPSGERKIFCRYFLTSIFVPIIINFAVLGINYAINGNKDIGYGKTLCYVSNFYSIVIGVLFPVAIVVLFNIVLLVLTVMSLRKMSTERENLTGKKENVYLYIKLSSLTGFNWLFAFVAPLTRIQALWYVFAVLCGLQGLYIFLAFVCNKRVLTLLKELCQRKGKEPTSAEGSSRATKNSDTSSVSLSRTSLSFESRTANSTEDCEQNNIDKKNNETDKTESNYL